MPARWLRRYGGIKTAMSRKDLLPGAGLALNLRQALCRASRDYVGGQNALALSMGVSADELAKRLNPADCRPIKPEWIEEILAITRDARLLDALVRSAGAVAFVPTPVPATKDALRALGDLLHEESDFVISLHKGAADGRWEAHEVAELHYHANRMVSAVLGIAAGAELSQEVSHG